MKLVLLISLVGSTHSFSPHSAVKSIPKAATSNLVLFQAEDYDDERTYAFKSKTKKVDGSGSGFDVSDLISSLQDKVQNFDISSLMEAFDKAKDNALSGDVGERGELYFFAQAALILCVLGGGIPFIGDFLMLLLGPGLLVLGLGVVVVSVTDLGTSLSPWPKPSGEGLRTDGLYSKLRHPMYAGALAACAGLSIVTGSASRLLLTALLLYVLEVKSDFEEAQLREAYPEYAEYASRVKNKFFPQEVLDALPWTKE